MDKIKKFFARPLVHCLIIILIGCAVYSNTLRAPFVFDDEFSITANPVIRDFSYFLDPSLSGTNGVQNFPKTRIVGFFTFAVNYSQHGLDVTGYHIINIMVHLINALLVYRLVLLTLKTTYFAAPHPGDLRTMQNSGSKTALFTALLFVSHPIQTQAVTYIVQRFASLATLFYLLSLVMYVSWRLEKQKQEAISRRPGFRTVLFYIGSLVSAVLAMTTKEISFTLPVVTVMYEFMFFKGPIKKRVLYLIPIALTMLIIPLTITGSTGSITDINALNDPAKLAGAKDITRLEYLYTQFRVIVTYIRLLFLPVHQNLDYDYPVYRTFFRPDVYMSFLFLMSIIGAGIYLFYLSGKSGLKDQRLLRTASFGIFWSFVTLSVESGMIPIADVIFEHRVYLPSTGFFMAAMSVIALTEGRKRKIVVPLLSLIVLALSVVAHERNSVWQDEQTLLEDTVRKSPGKARLHSNLGVLYAKKNRFDEACREFQAAIKLNPDYVEAHNNLGVLYFTHGLMEEAIKEYQACLKINPGYEGARRNLELLYRKVGN